ncbi:hydrophobin, partial [Vararia minispora EC-137]
PAPDPQWACNKGSLQCCNQVQAAHSVDFQTLLSQDVLSTLPQALSGSNTPVGLSCSPIAAATGASCNQQTVCCSNTHFSGVIAIGCMPINIVL